MLLNCFKGGNSLKKIKLVALLSIFCIFLVMPMAFAGDNETALASVNSIQDNVVSISNKDVSYLEIYFDSSVENDTGDGSQFNPYRDLKSDRIVDNSKVYFANGSYELNSQISAKNLIMIGSNPSNTSIEYNRGDYGFSSSSALTILNLTLINCRIENTGDFTASNTIFKDAYQGAILSSSKTSKVTLNNCTFSNNYQSSTSSYGGAISLRGGNLTINDTLFANNYASGGGAIYVNNGRLNIFNSLFMGNYATDLTGGSIRIENDAHVLIENTRIWDGYSKEDAAGAIYLKNSYLKADYLEVANCSSTFGGAIVSLDSNLTLSNFVGKNNRAKYDGGAIYALFNSFSIVDSILTNNSARNGGAMYVDDVENFIIRSNKFIGNAALNMAGAVYTVGSEFYYDSIYDEALNNSFIGNDVFESKSHNLFIGNGNYSLLNYNSSYVGNLPSYYNLRDLGYVTPVKAQGNGGNCWAFATLGSLESCILKASGKSYDLSEENMKNLMSSYSSYGWPMETNIGGYDKMGTGYLAGWYGPVSESDDVYNPYSELSPILTGLFHIQNIVYLTRTNYTNNDEIKKALMEYGAVATSIYWSSSYLTDKNYYYSGSNNANHAITIVGWDDNYSRDNFKNKPAGNGAWIIKNSWGTKGGDGGFYYVSYYDTKCAQINKPLSTYTFVLNDTLKLDKNYQYDIPGWTDFFINSSSKVWYKNRFVATDDEYLAAVSTYFQKNTNWDLSVYVNGILKLKKSGVAGVSYKTIDLGQLIPLKKGDLFEVMFKITVDSEAAVPISEAVSLNSEFYTEDISFISYDGKTWKDLYDLEWTYPDHTYASQVACIKAFTVFDKINSHVELRLVDDYNPAIIEARVYGEYGNQVNAGKVIFSIENKSIPVDIVNGVATLQYKFKNPNDNMITATFYGTGYNSNSSNITANVDGVYLYADDFVHFYGHIVYSAKLTDRYDNPVSGRSVLFKINNDEYIGVTEKNGIASVNLNLKVGNYTVDVSFDDMTLTRNVSILSTISLPSAVKYTLNSKYIVTLKDSNGKLLKNSAVEITIGSSKYAVYTDSNGVLNYNIDLKNGNYDVKINNLASGEIKSQKIKVVSRLSGNVNIVMYYGAGKYYQVRAYDDNGNVAKGVEVVFTFNGKTYKVKTNSSGYAKLKISAKVGTYKITATYKNFKVSNKITIKTVLITKDKAVKKGKVLKFNVKLLNSAGKILKNKKVTIKFKGKTYKVKTNSKGIATLKIKVNYKVGKYNIKTSYGTASVMNKITVKK